jgi:hypothetical protein
MRGVGSLATDRIGYRTMVIDVCLLFDGPVVFCCNVFPFPVAKAQLIGNWYENRQGAPNTIILLIFRQYYLRTNAPCANRSGGPNTKKKLLAHCAWLELPIGAGDIGAPINWRTEAPLRQYIGAPMSLATSINVIILNMQCGGIIEIFKKEADRIFRCASPIFMTITY